MTNSLALREKLIELLQEHSDQSVAVDCLVALGYPSSRVRMIGGIGPRDHIVRLYKLRAASNTARQGPIKGYELLIPALDEYVGSGVRIANVKQGHDLFILFLPEDMSRLLGLLHNPIARET